MPRHTARRLRGGPRPVLSSDRTCSTCAECESDHDHSSHLNESIVIARQYRVKEKLSVLVQTLAVHFREVVPFGNYRLVKLKFLETCQKSLVQLLFHFRIRVHIDRLKDLSEWIVVDKALLKKVSFVE